VINILEKASRSARYVLKRTDYGVCCNRIRIRITNVQIYVRAISLSKTSLGTATVD